METRFEKIANASGASTRVEALKENFYGKLGYYFKVSDLVGKGVFKASYLGEFFPGPNQNNWEIPKDLVASRWEELKKSKKNVEVWKFNQPSTEKPAHAVIGDIIALCQSDERAMAYAKNVFFGFRHVYGCLKKENCTPCAESLRKVNTFLNDCI